MYGERPLFDPQADRLATASNDGTPDAQLSSFVCRERPNVADSRRLGDETHPQPPNGDLRPILAVGP